MYCEKCGLKRHFFSWRKICRRVWFFLWCLCIDAVRKRLLFLLFFCCICWVCCDCPQNWWFSWCWSINAVVEFKREVSSSFSKTTQGVCAPLAPYTIKLSLFQQIQGHIPHHLKISFSQHMVDFFQSAIKFKVEYFVSWVSLKKRVKEDGVVVWKGKGKSLCM